MKKLFFAAVATSALLSTSVFAVDASPYIQEKADIKLNGSSVSGSINLTFSAYGRSVNYVLNESTFLKNPVAKPAFQTIKGYLYISSDASQCKPPASASFVPASLAPFVLSQTSENTQKLKDYIAKNPQWCVGAAFKIGDATGYLAHHGSSFKDNALHYPNVIVNYDGKKITFSDRK